MIKSKEIVCGQIGYIVLIGLSFLQITKAEETCIFINSTNLNLRLYGESYFSAGRYNIPEIISDSQQKLMTEVSMKVLVDQEYHDGILFAVGNTPKFKYYEWKLKAVHTVFMVVEFVYSALSVLLKARGQEYMEQVEIYRTFPVPYNIRDNKWHSILVKQENNRWTLKFDNITVTTPVQNTSNISLTQQEVFIGGRPGYQHWQFRGLIADLQINKRRVDLLSSHVKTVGNATIVKCYPEGRVGRRRPTTMRPQTRRNRRRNKGSRRGSRYTSRP